jgi:hypothetical protein
MGTSDSEYSSNVLVRNLKSCEEVVKKRGAKKKTGGAKKKTGGLAKSDPRKGGLAKSAPRKSRIARYDKENEEDDDDGMDNEVRLKAIQTVRLIHQGFLEEEKSGENDFPLNQVRVLDLEKFLYRQMW